KIEGFFDVCAAKGLSGKQGVIIPAVNRRHLMLKKEVVEAIAAEQFFIYLVKTVDEAVSLLTGLDAGGCDNEGAYPADSLNGRVEAALLCFARDLEAFDKDEEKEKKNQKTS
ncbi:MAG: ATP-dependent protease, partial [Candidatus Electrothrix sp. ATG2]|nr:ATP-dependent protease [Candidatus Electrothrix sp. ATG2]